MIKGSAHASLPQTAVRDGLRRSARAALPRALPLPPETPAQARHGEGGAVHIGPYRLDVDDQGRLVAVHQPSGETAVLLAPPTETPQKDTPRPGKPQQGNGKENG